MTNKKALSLASSTHQTLIGGPNRAKIYRERQVSKLRSLTNFTMEYLSYLHEKINSDQPPQYAIAIEEPHSEPPSPNAVMRIFFTRTGNADCEYQLDIKLDGDRFIMKHKNHEYTTNTDSSLANFVHKWIIEIMINDGLEDPTFPL